MRLKKVIAAGLASVALLGTVATSVSAAKLQLIRKSYVYNAKGKKTKKFYRKGKKIKVLSTKKIKGKKFYKIGKNKYVLYKNLKKKKAIPKPVTTNTNEPKQPQAPVWESKHLVDTLPSLQEQIEKAFTLQGDDRLEADKEIANRLGLLSTKTGNLVVDQKKFEQSLQGYVGSMEDARSWIEQGGPSFDQHMKNEQQKFGDWIANGKNN